MAIFIQRKYALLAALVVFSTFISAHTKTTVIAQSSNENPSATSVPRQHSNDARTDSNEEHGSASDNVKAPNAPKK